MNSLLDIGIITAEQRGEMMSESLCSSNHAPIFKTKMRLEVATGEYTLSNLAKGFDVHTNQIRQWKTRFLERMHYFYLGQLDPDECKIHLVKMGPLLIS